MRATSWIPLDKLANALTAEPALVVLTLAIASYLLYRIFLRELSPHRHRNLGILFANLLYNTVLAAVLIGLFWVLSLLSKPEAFTMRVVPYVGLLALFCMANVFVKTCRILLFEYLFLKNMRTGVPLLLVNIFTLMISFVLGGFFVTEFMGLKLAPLLATSAFLSVVFGLALQDTLGNLFAGISLQIDKSFGIGDWVEVTGTQKFVGQVHEISWRATVLISMTDELITIPNRLMAQSHIANFSTKGRPFIRSLILRLPFTPDYTRIRNLMLQAAKESKAIYTYPEPFVLFTEVTDSWVTAKLVYYLDTYGSQLIVADKILSLVLAKFEQHGIKFAHSKLELVQVAEPVVAETLQIT